MPMIEFRYKPGSISDEQAGIIGSKLEDALRRAIEYIRKKTDGYNITVEGDPFGPINHNQPDLRIYIFYHEEWRFTENDLECLSAGVGQYVACAFSELKLNKSTAAIRFYARAGHSSVKIG